MSMASEWIDDGHTIELAAPTEQDGYAEIMRITCPGPPHCRAGHALCGADGCSHGEIIDGNDEAADCTECNGTGWHHGQFRCWLKDGNDNADALTYYDHQSKHEPGIYRLLVSPARDAEPEDWFVFLRLGECIAPPSPLTRRRRNER